jgi:hypothetical protein
MRRPCAGRLCSTGMSRPVLPSQSFQRGLVEDIRFASEALAVAMPLEIANSVEPVQDGRIYIEKINWPFL